MNPSHHYYFDLWSDEWEEGDRKRAIGGPLDDKNEV